MRVASPDDMDDQLFLKHFNLRHAPVAGLASFRGGMTDGVMKSIRAYHQHVHFRGEEEHRPVTHHHTGIEQKEAS